MRQALNVDMFEELPVPILVFDGEGRIIEFNKTCEVMSGHDFKVMQGTTDWLYLVPDHERIEVEQILSALKAGKSSIQLNHHWCQKNGLKRLFMWHYASLNNGNTHNRAGFFGIGIEITEQHRMQQLADFHREEICRQQRVLSANKFASYLAHETSQCLTAIMMFADANRFLLDHHPLDIHQLRDNLQHITQQSLTIAEIFKQLNNYKKQIESNIPIVMDITEVAKNVCTLIRSKIESNHICLKLKFCENLPRVSGIKSQLELVVLNLFNNAIESILDAGNSSGTIWFETRQDNNMVHVIVRDSGPGVNADTASKLFQSLYTSKEYGLGVGLLVSRSLIENNGGRLWVESSSKEGIFHFVLPYAPNADKF